LKNGTAQEPIFTATRSSVREAGRRCAAMLIGQIESGERQPRSDLMEAILVLGSSTGPAPNTRKKA
jgi:LacI family transcriptional regulator